MFFIQSFIFDRYSRNVISFFNFFLKKSFFIIKYHKFLSQNTIKNIPNCSKILYKGRNLLDKNEKYIFCKLFCLFAKFDRFRTKNMIRCRW